MTLRLRISCTEGDLMSCVAEPPRSLYLAVDGRRLDPGNLFLPVKEGAELAVSCFVEGGHPPASLAWLLTPHHTPGLNTSGGNHPHSSEAHLGTVLRAHHNSTVTCLARHQALSHPLNQSLQLHVQCEYSQSGDLVSCFFSEEFAHFP